MKNSTLCLLLHFKVCTAEAYHGLLQDSKLTAALFHTLPSMDCLHTLCLFWWGCQLILHQDFQKHDPSASVGFEDPQAGRLLLIFHDFSLETDCGNANPGQSVKNRLSPFPVK